MKTKKKTFWFLVVLPTTAQEKVEESGRLTTTESVLVTQPVRTKVPKIELQTEETSKEDTKT
jgi:hypothetical protein